MRQIVVAAVNGEPESLGEMFARMLAVIREAFQARVIRAGMDGEAMDLGPDPYVRLTAVDRFIKLLTAGRPVPRAANAGAR